MVSLIIQISFSRFVCTAKFPPFYDFLLKWVQFKSLNGAGEEFLLCSLAFIQGSFEELEEGNISISSLIWSLSSQVVKKKANFTTTNRFRWAKENSL